MAGTDDSLTSAADPTIAASNALGQRVASAMRAYRAMAAMGTPSHAPEQWDAMARRLRDVRDLVLFASQAQDLSDAAWDCEMRARRRRSQIAFALTDRVPATPMPAANDVAAAEVAS